MVYVDTGVAKMRARLPQAAKPAGASEAATCVQQHLEAGECHRKTVITHCSIVFNNQNVKPVKQYVSCSSTVSYLCRQGG